MEGMLCVIGNGRVVVPFVISFVPVRGTGSISNPSGALPTLGKVLIMTNLATNSNEVSLILVILSRGCMLLPPHGRQVPLKVELHVEMVSHAFNCVQVVMYSIHFSMEGFDHSMSVMELL